MLKGLWEIEARIPDLEGQEFFPIAMNRTKLLESITSKQFRTVLNPGGVGLDCKWIETDQITRSILLGNINRTTGIRHKNSLLRIWNGDILSNDRLFHMGLMESNLCKFCNLKETADHRMIECERAKSIWEHLGSKSGGAVTELKDLFELDYDFEIRTLKLELISILLNDNISSSESVLNRSERYISILRGHSIHSNIRHNQ